MGLSPYERKSYRESKKRRRQAIYQSETGRIVPFKRNKKPLIIIITVVLALIILAACVLVALKGCGSQAQSDTGFEEALTEDESLRVVDRLNKLDEDFVPDLESFQNVQVNEKILGELSALCDLAADKGISLKIVKGYVSYSEQQQLYEKNLEQFLLNPDYTPVRAQAAAQRLIPEAGCSEFQTGLLVEFDLSDSRLKSFLERECINFGFILRYPDGKEDITHIAPSDSVYRYVGVENAEKMRSFDMCLEEYSNYIFNGKTYEQ